MRAVAKNRKAMIQEDAGAANHSYETDVKVALIADLLTLVK